MVKDKKAELLEAKGLFRRAAARWMDVMSSCSNDHDREWIKCRREACLEKAKMPPPDRYDFSDLHKAATETQQRMGIAQPNGEAFRLPESRQKANQRKQ